VPFGRHSVGLFLLLGVAASPAAAQTPRVVLDVPYVTQTADLNGGAAVTMVLRYWGEHQVVPKDFAALIDPKRKGIPESALIKAVSSRGWRTSVLPIARSSPDVTDIADEVEEGRPTIVLLEVAPQTYHYVVVVAVTDRDVIMHDSAKRPYETMSVQGFTKAWEAAGSWALVVLPAAEPLSRPRLRTVETTVPADLPMGAECATLIARAVAASKAGDTSDSEQHLAAVTTRCSENGAGWRDLAGLRFVNSQWEEARVLAQKAVKLSPDDRRSWRILGASLFVSGNALGALQAWNRAGDPRVESVIVSGANRTRHSVIVDRLGVAPGQLLTPMAFRRAARRAADLPAATDAAVRYFPHDAEGASLEVDVHEGQPVPYGWGAVASVAGRGILVHEIKLPFAGPTGNGERIDLEYGWKLNHPRAALRLTAPAPGPVPGLVVVELSRSRQTFAAAGSFGSGRIVEDHDALRVGLEDWATGRIHWNVDGTYGRVEDEPLIGIGGGVDTRLFGDRVALQANLMSWAGTSGLPAFRTGALSAHWRQRVREAGWSASAGTRFATTDAPLSFWSGADVGSNREAFLRAHKFLTTGIVTSDVFGRWLKFFTVEYERPVLRQKFGTVGAVGFVDGARAWKGMIADHSAGHIDVGIGLRVHAGSFGDFRVDAGYGLGDGKMAIFAGLVRPWPLK
jgi:predicted double-glycine peptidase